MEQNKYELGVIVRANLDDEALQNEMDRIKGLLDRFGATIEKEDKWGRRKLAYPIQKQVEGVYTFITYSAPSTTPYEVESRLRLLENVLRFLTTNINEAELRKAKAVKAAPQESAPVVEPVVEPVAESAEEPVVETVTEPVEVEEPATEQEA